MVDAAIGGEDTVVLEAGTLLFGAPLKGFAEAFGVSKGGRAGTGILSGGECRGCKPPRAKQDESQDAGKHRSRPGGRRVGGQNRGSDSTLHRRPRRASVCFRAREPFVNPAVDTPDYRCGRTTGDGAAPCRMLIGTRIAKPGCGGLRIQRDRLAHRSCGGHMTMPLKRA